MSEPHGAAGNNILEHCIYFGGAEDFVADRVNLTSKPKSP